MDLFLYDNNLCRERVKAMHLEVEKFRAYSYGSIILPVLIKAINSTVQNTIKSFPKDLKKVLPTVALLKLMSI